MLNVIVLSVAIYLLVCWVSSGWMSLYWVSWCPVCLSISHSWLGSSMQSLFPSLPLPIFLFSKRSPHSDRQIRLGFYNTDCFSFTEWPREREGQLLQVSRYKTFFYFHWGFWRIKLDCLPTETFFHASLMFTCNNRNLHHKLFTAVINFVTRKARLFFKTNKNDLTITKALAYSTTEFITAVKSFRYRTPGPTWLGFGIYH